MAEEDRVTLTFTVDADWAIPVTALVRAFMDGFDEVDFVSGILPRTLRFLLVQRVLDMDWNAAWISDDDKAFMRGLCEFAHSQE